GLIILRTVDRLYHLHVTKHTLTLSAFLFFGGIFAAAADSPLDAGFANPPLNSRIRAYWWWLNGNVNREAITRDLEEMRARGFGGALICDAGGADQRGNAGVPH